jgi:hypothetical protein
MRDILREKVRVISREKMRVVHGNIFSEIPIDKKFIYTQDAHDMTQHLHDIPYMMHSRYISYGTLDNTCPRRYIIA